MRLVASKKWSFKKKPSKKQKLKKNVFVHNIKMPNLNISLDDLRKFQKLNVLKAMKACLKRD